MKYKYSRNFVRDDTFGNMEYDGRINDKPYYFASKVAEALDNVLMATVEPKKEKRIQLGDGVYFKYNGNDVTIGIASTLPVEPKEELEARIGYQKDGSYTSVKGKNITIGFNNKSKKEFTLNGIPVEVRNDCPPNTIYLVNKDAFSSLKRKKTSIPPLKEDVSRCNKDVTKSKNIPDYTYPGWDEKQAWEFWKEKHTKKPIHSLPEKMFITKIMMGGNIVVRTKINEIIDWLQAEKEK